MDEPVLLYPGYHEKAALDFCGVCICLHYSSCDFTLGCDSCRAFGRRGIVSFADGASCDLLWRYDAHPYEAEAHWPRGISGISVYYRERDQEQADKSAVLWNNIGVIRG